MKTTAARTGLVALAVLASVLNGSPLALPVFGFAALILYRLVDYGAREVERALNAASDDRVAQLTWEIRTAAAVTALQERRLADQADRWFQAHPYTPAPRWPSGDPDDFVAQLETMLLPAVSAPEPRKVPSENWTTTRGDDVDVFEFADGGLLCVPAALQLYRYADAP